MLEVKRIDEEPVSVRIGGQEFKCEGESGYVTVPKEFLTGLSLSDIPADISIKSVERLEGHIIHIKNDVALSQFSEGSASAAVEEMFRRKQWDGETGLSPYVAALRQSIAEDDDASETDFQDDGDYIFLHYSITILEDVRIQEATRIVDASVERIRKRADQLVSRKRDGLLGIFDRGSFDCDLSHALNRKHPVTLVMADPNHFKQINDTFGHFVGDEVLRAVAKILASRCDGPSRVPYRYGGDELAIILTGTEAAKGAEITETIRADIEQLQFDAQPELRPTISLGMAEASDVNRSSAELVKRADAALYRAKKKGRNAVLTKWRSLTRNQKLLFVAAVGALGAALWFGIRPNFLRDVRKPRQNAVTETNGPQDKISVEVHHADDATEPSTVNHPPRLRRSDLDNVTEAIWFGIHGQASRALGEQIRAIDPKILSVMNGTNSVNTIDNFPANIYDAAWRNTFGRVLICDPGSIIGSAIDFVVSRHPSITVQVLNASFNGAPCVVTAHVGAAAVTNSIHGFVFTGNTGPHFPYILDLPIQKKSFGFRFYMTGEQLKGIAQGFSPSWKSFAIDDPAETVQMEVSRKGSPKWIPMPEFQQFLPRRFTLTTDLFLGGPQIVREYELSSTTPHQIARGDDASQIFVWAFTWHRVHYDEKRSDFRGVD